MPKSDYIPFTAGCRFFTSDSRWREKIFRGGLMLMIPMLGWPVVLGYRKEVVAQLVSGGEPLLPEWDGKFWYFLQEGLKCIAVIFGYLLPVTAYVWWRIYGLETQIPILDWQMYFLFFLLFPIFSPLALPGLIVYLSLFEKILPQGEALLVLLAYHALVFMIPLGFIQVSLSGRFRSAFNLRVSLRLLTRNPINYGLAWFYSSLISLLGHFCIPFSPWGVVWAYLAIVYYFNSILYLDPERRQKLSSRWLSAT